MANRTSSQNQFAYLLLALMPLALYYSLFFYCAVNAPVWDDYDSVLNFALSFESARTVAERFSLLFSPHNEHRLVLLHLATLSSLTMFGRVDFIFLCAFGNFFLLLLALLLWSAFREGSPKIRKTALFVPVLALLFQPQYYDTLLWPTVLLSNFPVAVFALASFRALRVISLPRVLLALFFALFAALSQTNGVCVLFLGLLKFWPAFKRREYSLPLVLWLLCTLAGVFLLALASSSSAAVHAVYVSFESLWTYLSYFLGFIGSAAADSKPLLSVLVGAATLLFAFYLFFSAPSRRLSSLSLFLLFCVSSVLLNTLGRGELGLSYAVAQPRYKFLSILILISVYLSWLQVFAARAAGPWLRGGLYVLAFVFCILMYVRHAPKVIDNSNTLEQGLIAWQLDRSGLYYPVLPHAAAILERSLAAQIYAFPLKVFEHQLASVLAEFTGDLDPELLYSLDEVLVGEQYVQIRGWGFSPTQGRLLSKAEPLLEREGKLYALNSKRILRPDVALHFRNPLMFACGFSVLVEKRLLEAGNFKLGVAVPNPYLGNKYIVSERKCCQ